MNSKDPLKFMSQIEWISSDSSVVMTGIHSDEEQVKWKSYSKICYAQFSETGAHLDLFFDLPLDLIISSRIPCHLFFEPKENWINVAHLGSSCELSLLSNMQMRLSFQSDASIRPLDYLLPKPNAITVLNDNKRFSIDEPIIVYGNDRCKAPVVQVQGPSIIGPCSDVQLDISGSFGYGGQFVKASFTVSTDAVATRRSFKALQVYLSAMAHKGNMKFTVPGYLLESGITYLFKLSLTSILGKTGTTVHSIEKIRNRVIPLVLIEMPNEIEAGDTLDIRAVVERTICGPEFSLVKYRWMIESEKSNVTIAHSNTSFLSFPRFHFQPGTFVVHLKVRIYWGERRNATFDVQKVLKVRPNRFSVSISGGNRKVHTSSMVDLSVMLDRPTFVSSVQPRALSINDYKFEWSCVMYPSLEHCPFYIPLFPTVQVQLVQPGDYLFNVHVHRIGDEMDAASAEVMITSVSTRLPLFNFIKGSFMVKSDDRFNVEAKVDLNSIASFPLRYEWKSSSQCGDAFYAVSDSIKGEGYTTSNVIRLGIREASLSSGSQYCIQLKLQDQASFNEGYALLNVMNDIEKGSCKMVNSIESQEEPILVNEKVISNYGIIKEFEDARIYCQSFHTDKACEPLLYQIGIKQLDGSLVFYPSKSSSPLFNIQLARGNYEIIIRVSDACNTFNAISSDPIYIKVTSNQSFKDYIKQQYDLYKSTKSLAILESILFLLAVNPSSMQAVAPSSFSSSSDSQSDILPTVDLIKLLRIVFLQRYLSSLDSGPFYTQILLLLTRAKNSSHVVDLSELLETLSKSMNKDSQVFSKCYDSKTALALYEIMNNIVSLSDAASSSFTREQKTQISTWLYNTELSIEQCMQRNTRCGEEYVKIQSSSINGVIGRFSNLTDACDVQLEGTGEKCIRFKCTEKATSFFPSNSSFVINSRMKDFSIGLSDSSSMVRLNFTIEMDGSLQDSIAKNAMSPLCVSFDRKTSSWKSDSCSTVGFNKTHVGCSCLHSSTKPIEISITLTSSQTQSTNHVAVIVGSVLAGVLLIAIILLIIWYRRKKRKNRDDEREKKEDVVATPVSGDTTLYSTNILPFYMANSTKPQSSSTKPKVSSSKPKISSSKPSSAKQTETSVAPTFLESTLTISSSNVDEERTAVNSPLDKSIAASIKKTMLTKQNELEKMEEERRRKTLLALLNELEQSKSDI